MIGRHIVERKVLPWAVRRAALRLPLLVFFTGAFAQEAPIRIQLMLPDFFETPFAGDHSLIEVPERPIGRMKIRLLKSAERSLSTGAINVWVNGSAISNIFDSRNVADGTELTMDASTMGKRPDQLFDPRENALEVLATDNRGRKYYQSWILRTTGSHNPYFAYQGTVSPDDPKGVPPDVLLTAPMAPPVLKAGQATARITVKGTCSSENPAVAMKIGSQAVAIQSKSESFEQAVDIRRDMKELVIEATDKKQNRRTIVIPIVVQGNNAPKPHASGGKYALVVGISNYGDGKGALPSLPQAAADAGAVARDLEAKAGFRKDNIRILRDDAATRDNLRIGLYDFAAKAQADDLLVIYVAGRAVHDPQPGNNEKMYLASYGTQMKAMDGTAVSFLDLEMWLNQSIRSNHTFVIFDVGHEVEGDWKFPGPSLVNNHLLSLFSDQKGRAVLTSGSAGEVSLTRPDGQSSFTYWLTRGFTGEADLNQDRVVTADELFRFVEEKVREESAGKQIPNFRLPSKNAEQSVGEGSAPAK
jgi:Caspase domain